MAAAGPSNGSMGVAPPRRPAKRMAAGPTPDMTMTGMSPRVPATNSALQLSTFEVSLSPLFRLGSADMDCVQSNYSTEDFVAALSEKQIAESKSKPGPFDPKPFLATFSPALDNLLSLRQQVADRTKKMESDVRRAEREYGKRLRELDGGFEVSSGVVNRAGER